MGGIVSRATVPCRADENEILPWRRVQHPRRRMIYCNQLRRRTWQSVREEEDNNIIQAKEEGMTIDKGRMMNVSYRIAETEIATWFWHDNQVHVELHDLAYTYGLP